MVERKKLIEELIEKLHAVEHGISAEIRSFFDDVEITPSQWLVLQTVRKKSNVSIKKLASLLGITSSASTQLVDVLVNKGFLLRKSNPDDRRTLNLELTEKSKKQFDSIKDRHFKVLSSLFNGFTDEELMEYCELSKKLSDGHGNK
ncbi:MAG: MarR family transcriptional regulator [Actinobacteria bacterium]|nr:MarR family transcriptional regulator [Actinomycetota bacterium]